MDHILFVRHLTTGTWVASVFRLLCTGQVPALSSAGHILTGEIAGSHGSSVSAP